MQGTSDKDGDLVLERSSGEYLKNSKSQYSSDDDTNDETEEIETNFDRDHLKNHYDDEELNVITLSKLMSHVNIDPVMREISM